MDAAEISRAVLVTEIFTEAQLFFLLIARNEVHTEASKSDEEMFKAYGLFPAGFCPLGSITHIREFRRLGSITL